MKKQQTAIEWLIEELGEYFPHEIGGIELMVKKAKEMEYQQRVNDYTNGQIDRERNTFNLPKK